MRSSTVKMPPILELISQNNETFIAARKAPEQTGTVHLDPLKNMITPQQTPV